MNVKGMNTEKKRNIFWLIILRLATLTSLIVSAIIIQYSTSSFLSLDSLYYLIFLGYFLSLIYFIFYLWGKNYTLQAHFQIIFDLLLITALVYISGGLNGSFYFLYIFGIIAASIIISSKAAYFIAALSAFVFGVLVDGMYFGIIPYFSPEQYMELSLSQVRYNIFIAWAIFFVIAFLVNYLTKKLRKAKEQLQLTRKELEIKNRLAVAGQVSASIAHEVRNPLTAISGSVQVLKNELKLSQEQKKLMSIVLKESKRVSQSIEQFLDFAIPGKQIFTFIELSAVLKEVLAMLRGSGQLNGLYCLEGNYESTKIRFYANINQFKQVFWNILRNSLKAMPDGGILKIDFIKKKNNEFQIKIADTGKGMAKEEKERIFEPFYSKFEDGRGLGMAIVYRIVEDYDGKIQIVSEIDKGTEVTITFPLKSIDSYK